MAVSKWCKFYKLLSIIDYDLCREKCYMISYYFDITKYSFISSHKFMQLFRKMILDILYYEILPYHFLMVVKHHRHLRYYFMKLYFIESNCLFQKVNWHNLKVNHFHTKKQTQTQLSSCSLLFIRYSNVYFKLDKLVEISIRLVKMGNLQRVTNCFKLFKLILIIWCSYFI